MPRIFSLFFGTEQFFTCIQPLQASGKNKNEKNGLSLVDLGYRRAKAAKAVKKALDSGKIVQKGQKKPKRPSQKSQHRSEDMKELFQSEMSEKKQRKNSGGMGSKKSKNSFKSKARYASIFLPLGCYDGYTCIDDGVV